MALKRIFTVATLAAIATIGSSAIPRHVTATYADISGCEVSCRVAAGGWPFAYVADYPGLSPVASADFLGYLVGADMLLPVPFAATVLFWSMLFSFLPLSYAHLKDASK